MFIQRVNEVIKKKSPVWYTNVLKSVSIQNTNNAKLTARPWKNVNITLSSMLMNINTVIQSPKLEMLKLHTLWLENNIIIYITNYMTFGSCQVHNLWSCQIINITFWFWIIIYLFNQIKEDFSTSLKDWLTLELDTKQDKQILY